ncbi:hypothetical protein GMAR_ORF56 [Golden Marseillevirus]|uniref:hypothetical protein n=1 Tax=Golden Marseillevirus TaxID=1720526 RepID=UPI000877AEEC|nr:hypothetical protein GMAR_ORF56 [Golden Marseillevirus]ALX27431.1 hypothetical protein GMAR_ORF56 [Golden Marseillevirus]
MNIFLLEKEELCLSNTFLLAWVKNISKAKYFFVQKCEWPVFCFRDESNSGKSIQKQVFLKVNEYISSGKIISYCASKSAILIF